MWSFVDTKTNNDDFYMNLYLTPHLYKEDNKIICWYYNIFGKDLIHKAHSFFLFKESKVFLKLTHLQLREIKNQYRVLSISNFAWWFL